MVTRQPEVKRRTAKVRLSETDVLPLSHETSDVSNVILGISTNSEILGNICVFDY